MRESYLDSPPSSPKEIEEQPICCGRQVREGSERFRMKWVRVVPGGRTKEENASVAAAEGVKEQYLSAGVHASGELFHFFIGDKLKRLGGRHFAHLKKTSEANENDAGQRC